jgi:glycosyltransferase involved in cell wall biosynthesis
VNVRYFATQGSGSLDARRIATLLEGLGATEIAFDRSSKARSFATILRELVRSRPDIVVMEGTGWAGAAAVLAARVAARVPFIVSSGDAVGPFLRMQHASLALPGAALERALYRGCAGFIGWSPYMVGRALTLGAPRGVTAENWSDLIPGDGARARERLGIPEGALVVGLVGSLNWSERRGYCYGLELVRAATRVQRDDLVVLVVGDGSGRERLEAEAGGLLGTRVLLPGRVPPDQVGEHLAALDVASLPQSLDAVGSLRYTTKISEYVAARVPVVTGRLPLAYDLDDGWMWRLPGAAPWSGTYVDAMAQFMRELSRDVVEQRRRAIPSHSSIFSRERQQRRICSFVQEAAEDSRNPEK